LLTCQCFDIVAADVNKEKDHLMKLESRLIIPADFTPEGPNLNDIENKHTQFFEQLAGTGVVVKFNSGMRLEGVSDIVESAHMHELKVFADLKLHDIPHTMRNDAEILKRLKPEILTVMCESGIAGMSAVQEVLAGTTEVLGVTILTSHSEESCQEIYGCDTATGFLRMAHLAKKANLPGLILSPQELNLATSEPELQGFSLNCPGIRPKWFNTTGDDQKRKMTPFEAIKAGAERIVVGRPIMTHPSPKNAIEMILEEIESGLAAR